MIAKINSAIPYGFNGAFIEIEADSNRGLPAFNIVGMPAKTITESRDRVRSAITNSNLPFPDRKITINLAPADLQKTGTHLDLPIAVAILSLSSPTITESTRQSIFVGELSLNGDLKPVKGIINIVELAQKSNISTVYLPMENYEQAKLIKKINIIPVKNLKQLYLHLINLEKIDPLDHEFSTTENVVKNNKTDIENSIFDNIIGHELAKRALTIAIAGHHNILFFGPPGTGKTLLSNASKELLPPLSEEEIIELTKIYSINSGMDNSEIINSRPFRNPHHTATFTSIIGGGQNASPGEVSLSHKGVLFLDELPEFSKYTLESLRQPLENKQVTISRANYKFTYPADFILIATMNPCPCGYYGDPEHQCTCSTKQVLNYQNKISGPLLDRIDIVLKLPRKSAIKHHSKSIKKHNNFSTLNVVKNNIKEVNRRQLTRFGNNYTFNNSISNNNIHLAKISESADKFLKQSIEKFNLSLRVHFKIIRLSRTIADLDNSEYIQPNHIAEALSFRERFSGKN